MADVLLQANGEVTVYEFNGSSWSVLGTPIVGLEQSELFGTRTTISGDGNTLAVYSPASTTTGPPEGKVQIFRYIGIDWQPIGLLETNLPYNDKFGNSISLSFDGNRIAVGSDDFVIQGIPRGAVYIYEYTTQWDLIGSPILGTDENDERGKAVVLSADGTRVAIGDPRYDGDLTWIGQVSVFDFENDDWVQIGEDITGIGNIEMCGTTLAFNLAADRLIVACPDYPNQARYGLVKIYDLINDHWELVGMPLTDVSNPGSFFGYDVDISDSGDRILITQLNDNLLGLPGAAKVFEFQVVSTIEAESNSAINLSPNPVQNTLQILGLNGASPIIRVFNPMGQLLATKVSSDQINLSKYPDGLYLIEINIQDQRQTHRIIKSSF
ncbi:MAG: T9SS type A sorting domain-containing protein [Bacteroidota bacterium]